MVRQWADELHAFVRAFSGAAVFGIPLVFTMEMWWIGKTLPITHLLVLIALAFLANLGITRVAGFREDRSLGMAIDQTFDALAVGIVSAAVLLLTVNQLRGSDSVHGAIGTVLLLAVPLSIGASVAGQVFKNDGGRDGDGDASSLSVWQGVLADAGATIIGGIFIGLSIAPTEEVQMIAAGLDDIHLFAVIGLSLLLSYMIVFASGFDEPSPEGPFQHPFTETVFAFVLSLGVAFLLLLLLDRIALDDPMRQIMVETAVLAVPVSIGGAGGRLVI